MENSLKQRIENKVIKVPNKAVFIPFLNERDSTGRLNNKNPNSSRRAESKPKNLSTHDKYIRSRKRLVFTKKATKAMDLNRQRQRDRQKAKKGFFTNTSQEVRQAGTEKLKQLIKRPRKLRAQRSSLLGASVVSSNLADGFKTEFVGESSARYCYRLRRKMFNKLSERLSEEETLKISRNNASIEGELSNFVTYDEKRWTNDSFEVRRKKDPAALKSKKLERLRGEYRAQKLIQEALRRGNVTASQSLKWTEKIGLKSRKASLKVKDLCPNFFEKKGVNLSSKKDLLLEFEDRERTPILRRFRKSCVNKGLTVSQDPQDFAQINEKNRSKLFKQIKKIQAINALTNLKPLDKVANKLSYEQTESSKNLSMKNTGRRVKRNYRSVSVGRMLGYKSRQLNSVKHVLKNRERGRLFLFTNHLLKTIKIYCFDRKGKD